MTNDEHPMTYAQKQIHLRLEQATAQARAELIRKHKISAGISEERRSCVRAVVDFPATYTNTNTVSSGYITEISKNGMRLKTTEILSIGTTIPIDINIGKNFPKSTLHIVTRVVRLNSQDASFFEYGLKVTDDTTVKATLAATVLQINLAANRTTHRIAPVVRLP